MTLLTGQLLAQRYRLERQIAVGGMGVVWQADDTRLGRQVAIKVLKPELSGDAEFRHRFHTEARMTASLNHPGIAAVHDYGETATELPGAGHAGPHIAFLVMELVAGDALATILRHHPRLTADRTLDILGQAGDALQAAHERGLVHRDIKPGNILITPTGRVKLTDFGIAKAVDTAPITRHGMVLGTAHYIAPEQAAGHAATPASDVYSLGVVGYECLAGRRPFTPDNPVTAAMMHVRDLPPPLPPDVPPAARALIEATLVKDPRQRYGSGGEFAAAVAAVRSGHRLPPMPAGLGDTAVTTALTGDSSRQTSVLAPRSQAGPPTGPYTGPCPSSRSGWRGVIGVVVALFAVLGLVVGGYLIRETVRSTGTAAGTGSAVPYRRPVAPAPSGRSAAAQPTTGHQKPATSGRLSARIFVLPTDYLFRSGSAAAATAKDKGLKPRLVDEQGAKIDLGRRSKCLVTGVDPAAGWVSPGSSLALTCKEGL
ncbi:MAG: protein kinase domain-containing protein [Pseudonocardiaceae bacterium]